MHVLHLEAEMVTRPLKVARLDNTSSNPLYSISFQITLSIDQRTSQSHQTSNFIRAAPEAASIRESSLCLFLSYSST